MSDMITAEAAGKLLDGTTSGPWGWNDSGQLYGFAGEVIIDYASYEGMWFASYGHPEKVAANSAIMAAAPDLARTVIALHAQLADAKAAQAMVVGEAAEAAGNAAVEALMRRKPEAGPVQIQMTRQNVRLPVLVFRDTDGEALVRVLRAERDDALEAVKQQDALRAATLATMRSVSAANAALEAQVARLVGAGEACDRVLHFDLRKMIVFGDDYNQAVKDAADEIRAALAEVQADARREGGE